MASSILRVAFADTSDSCPLAPVSYLYKDLNSISKWTCVKPGFVLTTYCSQTSSDSHLPTVLDLHVYPGWVLKTLSSGAIASTGLDPVLPARNSTLHAFYLPVFVYKECSFPPQTFQIILQLRGQRTCLCWSLSSSLLLLNATLPIKSNPFTKPSRTFLTLCEQSSLPHLRCTAWFNTVATDQSW